MFCFVEHNSAEEINTLVSFSQQVCCYNTAVNKPNTTWHLWQQSRNIIVAKGLTHSQPEIQDCSRQNSYGQNTSVANVLTNSFPEKFEHCMCRECPEH